MKTREMKWRLENTGYYRAWCPTQQRLVLKHRHDWEQANGPIPEGMTIDHIDGDPQNNALSNLRLVTQSDNMKNAKLRVDNKSGVPGVRWCKHRQKWAVQITSRGNMQALGRYDDWFEAVCARKSAEVSYGFHPNHGRSVND